MHLSLPKMCTSVLAKSFALFLAKNFAPQFLTFWNALSSHFPLPKTLHFSKQFVFFALSNGVIDRGSKQQSTRSNFRLQRSPFSSKKSKKWIKLIPKTIGNRKRDCAWGCAWGINTTWENLQIEKHKSGRRSFRSPNGINLIHFCDGKNNLALSRIWSFVLSFRSLVARLAPFERVGTKRENFFGNGKCELIAKFSTTVVTIKKGETGSVKGETKSANFWQGKV